MCIVSNSVNRSLLHASEPYRKHLYHCASQSQLIIRYRCHCRNMKEGLIIYNLRMFTTTPIASSISTTTQHSLIATRVQIARHNADMCQCSASLKYAADQKSLLARMQFTVSTQDPNTMGILRVTEPVHSCALRRYRQKILSLLFLFPPCILLFYIGHQFWYHIAQRRWKHRSNQCRTVRMRTFQLQDKKLILSRQMCTVKLFNGAIFVSTAEHN